MDYKLKLGFFIATTVAAVLYSYGWGYATVETYAFLSKYEFFLSQPYDFIRGYHTASVSLILSLAILAPLVFIFRTTTVYIALALGSSAYIYNYIIRAYQRDVPLPASLMWAFDSFQSLLVASSVIVAPFIGLWLCKTLLNKLSKRDAEKLGAPS